MNRPMVFDPLLGVELPLLIRLRPVVTVKLRMTLTARTSDAGQKGLGLHEEFVAVPAFDPSVVDGGEELGREMVVAGFADGSAVVAFFCAVLVFFGFGREIRRLDAFDGRTRGGRWRLARAFSERRAATSAAAFLFGGFFGCFRCFFRAGGFGLGLSARGARDWRRNLNSFVLVIFFVLDLSLDFSIRPHCFRVSDKHLTD